MRQLASALIGFFRQERDTAPPGQREQTATRAMFFAAGFATAAWAALIPFAKSNTGVGGGALVAMPATGILTTRFGCRTILAAAILLFSAALPLLSIIPDPWVLAAALLIFGVGIGTTDCAMNIQAILVEKAAPRPMMSGFHGYYSIGGIAGAGAMSGIMSMGVSPLAASTMVSVSVLALLAWSLDGLLTYANPPEGPAFAVPRGAVLVLGAICFAIFLAEGAMLDWSAVFLTEYRQVPEARGGLGFACFAAAMTLGRMTGDRVVARLGRHVVVVLGSLIAASGLLLTVFVPAWQAALFGYALIGIGCANIVPVMFSAIGRQDSMPQAAAVPAVTTLGYLGILAGPATIGFIAHHSGLPVAFLLIGVLFLAVAAASKMVKM